MRVLNRFLAGLGLGLVLLVVVVLVWLLRWPQRPLDLPAGVTEERPWQVTIAAGSSVREIAATLVRAGLRAPEAGVFFWLRISGQASRLKAGVYEFRPGDTPEVVLNKLVRGEQALFGVTLIEGWTVHQVLAELDQSPVLVNDLAGVAPQRLLEHLGLPPGHPEGRFFPDTYRVARGSTASALMLGAARAMERELAAAWAQRDPDTPLKSPEEALILASIVEKETGLPTDRPMIAGVFSNRLRLGMRLQTDPSVIYGLGERFDGNLRKADLLQDTPYNSYTRAGLPPTPIALPGRASLLAGVRPARTPALYFVAKGNGASHFSASLQEHNEAVRRYQLER